MPVHIREVSVRRLGPLGDFSFEPGRLCLVYGRNESGKTCLVEFILRALFRIPGRDAHWGLRDLAGCGQVAVSGLAGGDAVFSGRPRSPKLEDRLRAAGWTVPVDLARLLVIKGAEPALDARAAGGAGRAQVREYLTGQPVFEEIGGRIPNTAERVTISAGDIVGDARSADVSSRRQAREGLQRIDGLVEAIEQLYSRSSRRHLEAERQAVRAAVALQDRARRHQAFRLQRELDALEADIQQLPDADLDRVEQTRVRYAEKSADCARTEAERGEAAAAAREADWLEAALALYRDAGGRLAAQPGPALPILAGLVLAAAAAAILAGHRVPAALLLLAAAGLGAWHIRRAARAAAGWRDRRDIESIEAGFRERFGGGRVDGATLQALFKQADEARVIARRLEGDIRTLKAERAAIEETGAVLFERLAGRRVEPDAWPQEAAALKARARDLARRRSDTRNRLDRLGAAPSDLLADDPGVPYDPQQTADLDRRARELDDRLARMEHGLIEAKAAVAREVASADAGLSRPMEDWLGRLAEKRAALAEAYRDATASLIAQKAVADVLQDLRRQEDRLIDDGLASEPVLRLLRNVTRRYTGVEVEGEALKVSDGSGSWALGELSTGSRDQVLLALRMGFAARLAGADSLFLIFDDAFQHSDWERRRRLADELAAASRQGWQCLVFTMDDHIRDLFREREARMVALP